MKRPLLGMAGSFVLGEVLALLDVAGWIQTWMMVLCAAFAIATGAGLFLMKGGAFWKASPFSRRKLWGLFAILLFFLLGNGRAQSVRVRLDAEGEFVQMLSDTKAEVTGNVFDCKARETGWELGLERVSVRVGSRSGKLGRAIAYVDQAENVGIGVQVALYAELSAMEEASNPGQFNFARYYRSKGVACRLYADEAVVWGGEISPYLDGVRRFRAWCGEILENVSAPQDAGIFQAVVLGDQSGMDEKLRDMYRIHGISHLLAVSGQHLSIVGGGIYLILRKVGLNRRGAGLIGGGLVITYGILTGSSGSALRAVIMICCLWLGGYLGRTYDSLSAMGLAAILLLWAQPYLIFQSGFQLSFGAVWAIGALNVPLCEALRAKKTWQKSLILSLSVQLALAPMTVCQFYRYPMYGMFLNLLVVPFAAMLVYSGIAGIALGAIGRVLGQIGTFPGHCVLNLYSFLCGLFEHLPGYSVLFGAPEWGQIAGYAILGIGGVCGIVYFGRKRENAFWGRGLVLFFVLTQLCLAMLLPRGVSGLSVTFLDVGQGDGIVLEVAEGVVTVDVGSTSESKVGEQILAPYLESRARGRIACAIVSHGDADHMNGLLEVLESGEIAVERLVLPRMAQGQESYAQLVAAGKMAGAKIWYMKAGDRMQLGNLRLSCLYAGDPSQKTDPDKNRHSLVIEARYGEFGMLLTGDMDESCEEGLLAEQKENLKKIQVLKVAHHGSKTASSDAFLDAVGAKIAVLSYGADNSYGHPAGEVVERLVARKMQILETAKCGAVMLQTDGKTIKVRSWK